MTKTSLLFALALFGCGEPAGEIAVPAVTLGALKPVPKAGAMLGGPVAKPVKQKGRPRGGAPLDLGADRALVEIDAPKPPKGGAVGFTFGEKRRGWVAQIPEGLQLPALAYGDGKIFVSGGFESYSLYALDAEDGRIVWASKELEDDGPTAAIYYQGRVIFNTESCTLFVLDGETGQKLWFKYLGDPTLAQVAAAEGLVIASHPGGTGPEVSAYRLTDGAEVWTRSVDGELLAAPVIDGGDLYFSTITGRLYRLELKSGKKLWSKALGATSAPWVDGAALHLTRRDKDREEAIVASAETGDITASHVAVEGKYLGDVPRNLNDWKKVWVYEGSRPKVLGGVRYLAMGDRVEAADPETGEAFWSRRYAEAKEGRALGSVAVAGPEVVFSTREGELFGLDIDTGYTLFSYKLGHKVAAEPVVAKGWLYAATTDGRVIALNVADETLDGWHMYGGNPRHNGPVVAGEEKPIPF
jgi:Ca-activated chloride channel homolog